MQKTALCFFFWAAIGFSFQESKAFIRFIDLPVQSDEQIAIAMRQMNKCPHYAIGLTHNPEPNIKIAVAFLDGGTPSQPLLKSTIDGSSYVSLQNREIELDASSCPPSGAVLVYLKALRQNQVAIRVEGVEIARTLIGDGVLLKDGVVANRPVPGFAAVATAFFGRTEYLPPQQLSDGSYLVNPKILLDHVLERVNLPPQAMAPGSRKDATLKVTIDAAGRLVNIETKSGDEAFAALVAESLQRWKFRPIMIEGQARIVTCVLGFFVDQAGAVQMHGH